MSRTANVNTQGVPELTAKLYDVDADLRYMSLSDLHVLFNQSSHATLLSTDYNLCAKLIDGFLHTLVDPNGEVQNQTIKCIGPFVNRMIPTILPPMIHKFTDVELLNTVDLTISALAVRAIVISLPRPTAGVARTKDMVNAYSAISKVLIPRLVGYIVIPRTDKGMPDPPKGLLEADLEKGTDSNSIDVLTEVARCFGPMLQAQEVKALQQITLKLLEGNRTSSVMKKKAVIALSALSHYFSDEMLSSVISHIIESVRNPHLIAANRKLYITILGSMASAIPAKFGPHLRTLAPFVLSAVSQQELDEQAQAMDEEEERDAQADEVREAALVAIEAFLASCGSEMERYLDESIDATLRFIKYDPLVASADDDEDAEIDEDDATSDENFELDEDFEEEGAPDDEDDVSWKVRRCAAKTLHTIISARGRDVLENATNYDRVATALTARFKEREDNVRLEILGTIAFLIRKTGEGDKHADLHLAKGVEHNLAAHAHSRKRRRGNSDVSMSDVKRYGRTTGSTSPEYVSPPGAGPLASLAKLGPGIVEGLLKLLKSGAVPTKHAATAALKDYAIARQGGLDEVLDSLLEVLITTIQTSGSTTTAGTTHTTPNSISGTSLQIESLHLLAEILKTHSSQTFQAYLSKTIAAVTQATQDRSSTVSCEAFNTLEQIVKALTPPRSASASQKTSAQVEQILGTILEIISARNVDLSVRQQAIHVLGTLLGRTLGPQGLKLISHSKRLEAFELLLETSKNETTRYASIRAINAIGVQSTDNKQGFDSAWLSKTCLELGAQLRKADRSLRGASLDALRTLISERDASSNLDTSTAQQLTALLVPLFVSSDLHLLGPALVILAAMVRTHEIVNEELTQHICQLLVSSSGAAVLEHLCVLARSLGECGQGKPLMQVLLNDVGVNGSPPVVGKVIGNLLVSGKGSVGVTLKDFLSELKNAPDDRRKCLALAVLGEVGLRLGSRTSDLSPDLFMFHFGNDSEEVPLAAASALGRAAAGPGNVNLWVPAILHRIKQKPKEQYLVLHAIRELLQLNESDKDIIPFTSSLWDAAITASGTDTSRMIGAECIANLVMIQPVKLLTVLQSLLSDGSTTVRGTAILAFRDVFTVTDASYDKDLRPIMIDVLTTMMRDSDVDNRRSSLNTFNAAARNKSSLILPHLHSLMPLVVDQSRKDPSLIRDVKMGPFTHTVDDGLEVRKNAYETLYSLMDLAPTRLDFVQLFDRVVAGVGDDRGIQTLCNLMITKLMVLAPEETVRRLDSIGDQFRAILAFTPKENAVRPEVEKADESKRSVIRVSQDLNRAFPGESGVGGRAAWTAYLEEMTNKHGLMIKAMEKDGRGK